MIIAKEKDVHAIVMESPEVKKAAMKALISPKSLNEATRAMKLISSLKAKR